jgi:DNA-binding transcriptional regulator YhcF (GntR family)
VARAYRELETAGLVVTRRGGGTRVAAGAARPAAGRSPELARLAAGFVSSARALGATDDELRAALAGVLGAVGAPG